MRKLFTILGIVSLTVWVTSCSGGNSQSQTASPQSAMIFVTGGDAPLTSVLSFKITINTLALSDGTNTVQVLTQPATIEFSQLLGLRTLVALNSVTPGTYKSATASLASPVISFLDLSTTPASVGTINGTLTSNTVNVTFRKPLTIDQSGLGGLNFHIDLRNSLQTDANGQLTGVVSPQVKIRPLRIDDDDAHIDDLKGSLVSVNTTGNSFVLQRANGRSFTIDVNSQTQFEGVSGLSALAPPAILDISGKAQADGSILADHVQLLTTDRAFLSGIVLNATPPTGAATSMTLLVRDEIPVFSGINPGLPATVKIAPSTEFDIARFRLPVSSMLFSASSLVLGQSIGVGGTVDTTTNPASFATKRIVLRPQGLQGKVNPNSVSVQSGNNGSFQLVANGFFGFLFNAPLKVMTSDMTRFRGVNGLSGLNNVTGNLEVVGLLLKDASGNPVLVARVVQGEDEDEDEDD